jgi:ABC-type antimicrobial peptide transport system permease subunit
MALLRRKTAPPAVVPAPAEDPAHLIRLRQVVKVYENAAGGYKALKEVDLDVGIGELVGMYMALMLGLGLLALLVAVPLAAVASYGLTRWLDGMLNANPGPFTVPPVSLALQIAIGIAVPLIGAIVPVIGGARLTVRQAMADYGLSAPARPSLIDRLTEAVRGLPRPMLLSLRNTFRRKGRLALTLSTLVLGGAIFIAVFGVRESMIVENERAFGYYQSDVNIAFAKPYILRRAEEDLDDLGIDVTLSTGSEIIAQKNSQTNILTYLLLFMALLIAAVGGLGLMGTMSMNVLERTREIGVMRSIGAENGDILQLVVVEGMLIGFLSWAISIAVAIPITHLLDRTIGLPLMSVPLTYILSTTGIAIWLVVVLALAAVASLLPARNAIRLTIRDVLAYE